MKGRIQDSEHSISVQIKKRGRGLVTILNIDRVYGIEYTPLQKLKLKKTPQVVETIGREWR
jgi:hypothetical protein